MGLDIRIPLGLMFLSTGGLMTVYGLFTMDSAIYSKSLGININLDWGLLMFAFGLAMYVLGKRPPKPPDASARRAAGEQPRAGH